MLIKKNIRHKQNFPKCPVCEAIVKNSNYIYCQGSKKSYFYSCKNCTFQFAYPDLIDNLSDRKYENSNEMNNSELQKQLYSLIIIRNEISKLKKQRLLNQSKILDVGCGTGWTSAVYASNGYNVTCVEPSVQRSEIARKKYKLKVITAVRLKFYKNL